VRQPTILHLQLDGLCAAVAAKKHPHLAGRPFAVASRSSGGRVLDASQRAAELGVRRGEPIWQAQTHSADLVIVPVDPRGCEAMRAAAIQIMLRFTPQVTPRGIAGVHMDVTGSLRLFRGLPNLLQDLQQTLLGELDILPTIGVGPNPLVARIAATRAAPGAWAQIAAADLPEALDPLPVSYLWTVSAAQRQRLGQMGITTFGELRRVPSVLLRKEFGHTGELMFEAARGRDDTVIPVYEVADPELAVRHRLELPRPTRENCALRTAALSLAHEVGHSLRERNQSARRFVLAALLGNGKSVQRSRTLRDAVDMPDAIVALCRDMLNAMPLGARGAVRMTLAALDLRDAPAARQLSLFEEPALLNERLTEATDGVLGKIGHASIGPGTLEGVAARATA